MNVLLVEDEPNVQKLVRLHLEREQLSVDVCASGDEATALFAKKKYDLVILDWMLKGKTTGLDLCKLFAGKTAILMLTSRSEPSDVILGLEMGADDYITKPFELPVFTARVRALLRRSQALQASAPVPETFTVGDLAVNAPRVEVACCGKEIKLTSAEFKLLVALLKNQGRVLSREKLLREIQDEAVVVVERVIDTHVYTLRTKLGKCADFIETIRGIGYRIK